MLSRRFLAGLALTVAGLPAADVDAKTPGFSRSLINRIEAPDGDTETVQALVAIDAHSTLAPPARPWVESVYILEGGGILQITGQPDRVMRPGDTAELPANTPHALRNGARPTKILSICVMDAAKSRTAFAPL